MEPADVQEQTYMIIVASSTGRAEAEAAERALARRLWPQKLPDGYPRVIDSSTVDGLKPGFFVVSAGACDDRDEAGFQLELARSVVPDAYLRKVSGREDCPRLQVSSEPDQAFAEVARHPLSPGSKASLVVGRLRHQDPGCPDRSLVLGVRSETGATRLQTSFEGDCIPGDGEYLGRSGGFRDPEPVIIDGRTFLRIRAFTYAFDSGDETESLVGLACGKWVELVGGLGGRPEFGIPVFNRFDQPTPDTIRVRSWLGADGEGELPPDETRTWTLEPSTCTATLVPPPPAATP